MAKMVVMHKVHEVSMETYERPTVSGDKLLVRVSCCAICTWDQRAYVGENKVEFPFVGGHENVGVIEAIGPDVDTRMWSVGDRVAIGVTASCEDCYFCRTGHEECCEHFVHTPKNEALPYIGNGGFAEYVIIPTRCAFKYYNVSPHEAALIEPISCVTHSVTSAEVHLGDYVLVIGCGIMGQLHVQIAHARGACVIVSDTNHARTDIALQHGASYAIDPSQDDLPARILEITHGRKCQEVFDTTPFPSVLDDAYSAVSNAGKVILYSSIHPRPGESGKYGIDPNWMHHESIHTVGTANSNTEDFERAAAMVSEGIVDVKPFVSAAYPPEECAEAFEEALKPTTFRVLIDFDM